MKSEGKIVEVSSDGDLITDISAEIVSSHNRTSQTRILVDEEHETFGIFESSEGQPAMTLLAVQAGEDPLRLHLVGDSAAMMLGLKPGASVRLQS